MDTIPALAAQDALAALRTVSTAAGFATDPVVEEADKEGNNPEDAKWVVQAGDPVPRAGAPLGFEEVDQPVTIECYACPANADPTAVRTQLARMAGDVRRKLMEDPHRGGYAIYTAFPHADVGNAVDAPFFVRVTAMLWCRYRRGNPYEQQ